MSILLTTHYMHEAEILCDRLSIMNKGRVVAEGTPRTLIHAHTPGFVGVFSNEESVELRLYQVTSVEQRLSISKDSSGLYLRMKSLEDLARLHQDHQIEPLQIRPANLEDVFLKTTGEELSSDD